MNYFNELEPDELERLSILLEELGEAQHIIGKILRHGYESFDPTIKVGSMPIDGPPPSHPPTNRELLERELGDIDCAVEMMARAKDLNTGRMAEASRLKSLKVQKYLHHN